MNDSKEENKATQFTSGTDHLLQLVSFKLGNELFAVDILNIQGINRMVEITNIPESPDFVEGIINLRGVVIPIIDLRKRLGMPPREYDKNSRFIVVEIEGKAIGFVVDSVQEVLRIKESSTSEPPTLVSSVNADYITSVAKIEDKMLILLDLNRILSADELSSVENKKVDPEADLNKI